MKIGIDISQIVYEGTGVAMYVREIVTALLKLDRKNDYVLFGASLRKRAVFDEYFLSVQKGNTNVRLVTIPIPPTLLEILWNQLHVLPVELFVGNVDIFWSSDWTQPPLRKAKGVTTIHDLIALKYPQETDSKIVTVHKRRLEWVKKECQKIFCDSEATKKDIRELIGIDTDKLNIIYPGFLQVDPCVCKDQPCKD